MATVPYSGVPTVTQTPSSGLPYQTGAGATAEAFGSQIGQAEQGLGKQIESAGDMLEKHALFYQTRENQAEADQGFVDSSVELGKVKSWYNSLEGKDAPANYDTYVQKLNAVRDTAIGNISNPEAKRMFEREFNRRLVFDVEAGAGHAATQQKAYQKTASASVVTIAKQDSALNPEDQARFDSNLQTIKNKVDEQFPVDVWGQEKNEVEKRKEVAGAIESRLDSMAKQQPLVARDMLEKYKDQVDGITYNKLQRSVNQGIIQTQSRIDADKIVSGASGVSEDLVSKVKGFEGFTPTSKYDYKQYSIGYGTKGKPGETITKEEADSRLRDELGRSAQVVDQAFPGLPSGTRDALISLTYNSGTDWMKSGLGAKIAAGDYEGAKANFLEYNKAGGQLNQGLVNRRVAEVAMFGGAKTNPLAENRQASMMDDAHKRAQELFPDDPGNQATYEDTLQQRVKSNVTTLKQGIVQTQRENKNAVNAELLNPDKPITTLDQLTPQARDAYNKLNDVDQNAVRKRMTQNASVDPYPVNPERLARYKELYGMAKNPATKDQFADIQLANEPLPRAMGSELFKMQQNIKYTGQSDLKIQKLLNDVRPILADAGIRQSAADPALAKTYNTFYGQYVDEVQRFEDQHKTTPNFKENKEIVSKLIRGTNDNGWFFQSNPKQFETEVPKEFSDAASAAAKAKGRLLGPEDIRYLWNNQKQPQ